jgi:hypothetical protein
MEQLLQQLAKTLKNPTDALQTILDNYPKLRQEYVIYSSLGTIRNTMFLVIAFSVFLAWVTTDTDDNGDLLDNSLKMLKIEMLTFLTATVIAITLSVFMTVLAPDIAIIKEIINR